MSLKVSIAEVHLTRPPEQMSIWTCTRVNSIVSLLTMALSFIFLLYSCSAQTVIHPLNPSPRDFQLKKNLAKVMRIKHECLGIFIRGNLCFYSCHVCYRSCCSINLSIVVRMYFGHYIPLQMLHGSGSLVRRQFSQSPYCYATVRAA